MSLQDASAGDARDPRRRLPTGVLGMAILILVVEWLVARHAAGYRNLAAWEWRASALAARQNTRDCAVLFFGDSLVKGGMLPRAFETAYGRRAYNLAAGGGPPPVPYYLLRRALQAGARPAAIVVGFHPRQLQAPPQAHTEIWPYFLTWRESADLCWTARDAGMFAKVMLARLVPSIRYRLPIRALAMSPRPDPFRFNRAQIAAFARRWQANRGAMPWPALPPGRNFPDLDTWARTHFTDWACLKVNDVYLHRFLSLAHAHRIAVYWVLPPIMAEVHAFSVRSGYARMHLSYLLRLQQEFPNLKILDAEESGYAHAAFFDPHHLGMPGALALSVALGRELARRERQAGTEPRFARLPAYRPRKAEFPFEEVEEASLARRERRNPQGATRTRTK